MFIELHVGPVKKPTPVTINTNMIVDFVPMTDATGTNITLANESYTVMESYEKVREMVLPGTKKTDNTGERLRAREEFFRKGNECFNIRTGNRNTDLQGQADSHSLDK